MAWSNATESGARSARERIRSVRVSPEAFGRIAFIALALNVAIVLTGAAVRITGSGLGCPTWPKCVGSSFFGQWNYHYAIEWSNRVFTLGITAWVFVTLVTALLRTPRRRDLIVLAGALIGGIFVQIVLGGVTVLFKLEPVFVMAHFAVSMVMIVLASLLWTRARTGTRPGRPAAPRARKLVRLNGAVVAIVILLGTLTTAAGPHSGDAGVPRLGRLQSAVQLHSSAVAVLVAVALLLRYLIARDGAAAPLQRLSSIQVSILAAQAVLGITQYHLGLPGYLVELHVAGAVALWVATVQLWLTAHSAPAFELASAERQPVSRAGLP